MNPNFDFIEIGTSNFDTEIEKNDNKIGLSIEPVKYYLNQLPDKLTCKKLNIAISNYNGTATVYYIPEKTIIQHNLPNWVKGCNTINDYHKTLRPYLNKLNLNIEELSESYEVPVKTLFSIFTEYNINMLFFLKIDTEGHDVTILNNFYKELNNNQNLPHIIQFESNGFDDPNIITNIIEMYKLKGYDLIYKGHDTILQLNLNNVKNKNKFIGPIYNYYLKGYPSNYDLENPPHENNLESAKIFCIENNYSGIVFENEKYRVKTDKYIFKIIEGYYWKQSHNQTVYWSKSNLNIKPDIKFTSVEEYYLHRKEHGYPHNWSQINICDVEGKSEENDLNYNTNNKSQLYLYL